MGDLRACTLPCLSAVLCLLIAAPWRWEWLVWVALTPLLVWLMAPRRVAISAWFGSFAVALTYYWGLSWPLLSLSWWGWGSASGGAYTLFLLRQKLLMGLVVLVLSCWGGMLWGLCGWLTSRYATSPLKALWTIPCLWVVIVESLGHQALGGMSWGWFGYTLHGSTVMRQLASLTGVLGLSFVVLMVNAALACGWRAWRALPSAPTPKGHLRAVVTSGVRLLQQPVVRSVACTCSVVVLSAMAYGLVRLRKTRGPTPEALEVTVLQGNVTRPRLEDFTSEGLDRIYGPMLERAIAAGAELVVLPETVWLRTLQLDGGLPRVSPGTPVVSREALGRTLAKKLGGRPTIVVHGMDVISHGQVYNAMVFWSQEGLQGTYFKRRLVPFAEFQPQGLGWLSPQNQLHGSGFAYAALDAPQLVSVHHIPVGSFICQEVLFPELVRQSVNAGAHLLMTTGNDGVFESPWVARTLADIAVLRAVEQGRFLIRGMKTGVSAIIDPHGRVMAQSPINTRTILRARVAPTEGRSPYSRWGDWLVWGCGLLLVGLALPLCAPPKFSHFPS